MLSEFLICSLCSMYYHFPMRRTQALSNSSRSSPQYGNSAGLRSAPSGSPEHQPTVTQTSQGSALRSYNVLDEGPFPRGGGAAVLGQRRRTLRTSVPSSRKRGGGRVNSIALGLAPWRLAASVSSHIGIRTVSCESRTHPLSSFCSL